MYRLALLAALALTGCAATTLPDASPDHPALAPASTTPSLVETSALAPVEQPDLPAPLRPDDHPPGTGMAEMDHDRMISDEEGMTDMDSPPPTSGEAHMDHSGMDIDDAPVPNDDDPAMDGAMSGMSDVLDAYLAIHDALVADRFDGVPTQARALDAALTALTAEAPADDPHVWHTHAADLDAIHTHARALADAADLAAARVAFGELSVPFIRLVEATGLPEGYDIARMTCGVAPGVREGGVWLQRSGETANPYLGTAMPSCGTSEGAMPGMGEPGSNEGHDGHTP